MKVFVSFSRDDIFKVTSIVHSLKYSGFDVWWDQSLPPARSWESTLHDKLVNADAFCIILTQKSVDSNWVEKEYLLALEQFKRKNVPRIIPILLEDCIIPLPLSHIQVIDMKDYPDSVWGLTGLIKAISKSDTLIEHAVDLNNKAYDKKILDTLPVWQKALEEFIHDERYLSRSIMILSLLSNLSVLEVTKYCLLNQHILLSPYVTPAVQPIPYFGPKKRLLKRYGYSDYVYLEALETYLSHMEKKKSHREIKQCWKMIREHYVSQFKLPEYVSRKKLIQSDKLHKHRTKMIFVLARESSIAWLDVLVENAKKEELEILTTTDKNIIKQPISYLESAMSSASIVVIDTGAESEVVSYLLGYLRAMPFKPSHIYAIQDQNNMIFGSDFVTYLTPEEINGIRIE